MDYYDCGAIPMYRIKGTNIKSSFVAELAYQLGNVTINTESVIDILKYGRVFGCKSVFNEIEWLNPIYDIKSNIPIKNDWPNKVRINYWANYFISNLQTWFNNNLFNDEEYWIMHSSGNDSRILSAILKNMRDKQGFSPNVKFVSWYPEAEQAEKILKYIGWESKYIWKVGAEHSDKINENEYWNQENYYNYDDAGVITNGEIHPLGTSQAKFWRPYYKEVNHINVIMAMIADMVLGAKWWVRWAKRFYLNYKPFQYSKNLKWDILISASARYNGLGLLGFKKYFKSINTPTMEYSFVANGLDIPFICRYNDNIRKRIQEILCPGLSSIPNTDKSWGVRSQDVRKKMESDYLKSEFYRKYKHDIVYKSGAPALLSLASLYDTLSKNSIKVGYKK